MEKEVKKIRERLKNSSERLIGVLEAAPLVDRDAEKPNGFSACVWSETIHSARAEVFWCGQTLGVWDIYSPASPEQDWVIYGKVE